MAAACRRATIPRRAASARWPPRWSQRHRRGPAVASRLGRPTAPEDDDVEQELAQRENDGIAVTLHWHSGTDRLTVSVLDSRTGEAFSLPAGPGDAMDVFHHPYAYAAVREALHA